MQEAPKRKKVDVHRTDSDLRGSLGILEVFIRKFRQIAFLALLVPVIIICLSCIGIAATPAVLFFRWAIDIFTPLGTIPSAFLIGMSAGLTFFIYGMSLIFVVPVVNFLFPFKVKAWRGPWHSVNTIPWYVHNALTYVVRYTFLEFLTPTPFNILFYRMMGMKIGKGVVINTTHISDPSMITLDDYVTIGGSATIIGHYGQKGYLVIEPVHIKSGANIGLKASVMGDVVIGEKATIKPHAVLMPKTRVPDGETIGFY